LSHQIETIVEDLINSYTGTSFYQQNFAMKKFCIVIFTFYYWK